MYQLFDPDGVGVSKGIGFLHKCATLLRSMSREVEIFVPMFDPDGVGVSKGIGFLHQCATPLGSMRREVEIFAPMCDPIGVIYLLNNDLMIENSTPTVSHILRIFQRKLIDN